MNEIKPKITTSKDKSYTIVEYIYNNPRCSKSELNNSLSHNYEKNIMREMTRETLNNNVKYLLKIKHIISLENKKHGNKEYPNIFIVNIENLKYYLDLRKKKRFELLEFKEEIIRRNEISELYREDLMDFGRALTKSVDLSILCKNEDILNFSNKRYMLFEKYLTSLLLESFFNNPDLWVNVKSPEDLEFEIKVKVNWHKDKRIYERMLKNKKKCFKDEYLYPFCHPGFSFGDKEERSKILKGKTEQDIFNQAFTESMLRKKAIRKNREEFKQLQPIRIEQVEKEIDKTERDTEKVRVLRNFKEDIERGYIPLYKNENILSSSNLHAHFISKETKEWSDKREHDSKYVFWINKKYTNKKIDAINKEIEERKKLDSVRTKHENPLIDKLIDSIVFGFTKTSKEEKRYLTSLEIVEKQLDRLK